MFPVLFPPFVRSSAHVGLSVFGSLGFKGKHLDGPHVTPTVPNMSCCSQSAGVKAMEVLIYTAL